MQEVAEGEKADALLPVLAWQPDGRHLYAAQRDAEGQRVILYELNGLQHGSFDVAGPGWLLVQEFEPGWPISYVNCLQRHDVGLLALLIVKCLTFHAAMVAYCVDAPSICTADLNVDMRVDRQQQLRDALSCMTVTLRLFLFSK